MGIGSVFGHAMKASVFLDFFDDRSMTVILRVRLLAKTTVSCDSDIESKSRPASSLVVSSIMIDVEGLVESGGSARIVVALADFDRACWQRSDATRRPLR